MERRVSLRVHLSPLVLSPERNKQARVRGHGCSDQEIVMCVHDETHLSGEKTRPVME